MLNFKDWSKIAGDEKTSTLRHEKGHIMTIAHDSLPRIQMEQLKRLKLADGGEVKGVHTSDAKKGDELNAGTSKAGIYSKASKEYESPGAKKFWKNSAVEQHEKVLGEMKELKGHDRKYLSDGGPTSPPQTWATNDPVADQKSLSDDDTSHLSPEQKDRLAAYGGKGGDTPIDDGSSQPVSHDTHITINAAPAPSVAQPNTTVDPASVVPIPTVDPTVVKPGSLSPSPLTRSAQETMGANAQQQQAIQEQAQISSAASQQEAINQKNYLLNRQHITQMDQDNYNDVKQHTDEFAQYMKANPIRPNAYLQDMGTGQKVATALGLLLGGFKQGFSGGSNPAMDFLNSQIDRNVAAQQANANQQKTVWGAYNNLYNNANVATALAKVSANDMLVHQASLAAARLGTPQAQQAANALAAQKELENTKLRTDAAGLLTGSDINSAKSTGRSAKPSTGNPNSNNGLPVYHILSPGAVQKSVGLNSVDLVNKDKLQSQLTSAQQAEKVLNGPKGDGIGGIDDLLNQMYDDIGQGETKAGLETSVKQGIGHVPFVGGIGEGALNLLYQGEGYKDYKSKQQALKTDLGSALQNLISVNDLDKIVEANSPIRGDTRQDVDRKKQMIVNTVKKALKTDELEKWHLVSR